MGSEHVVYCVHVLKKHFIRYFLLNVFLKIITSHHIGRSDTLFSVQVSVFFFQPLSPCPCPTEEKTTILTVMRCIRGTTAASDGAGERNVLIA